MIALDIEIQWIAADRNERELRILLNARAWFMGNLIEAAAFGARLLWCTVPDADASGYRETALSGRTWTLGKSKHLNRKNRGFGFLG
jgi:hypothetical protein